MSLLTASFEPFIFMEKQRVQDDYGGYGLIWSEGAEFEATADFPQSTNSIIADKLTERVNCTITTTKAITLQAYEYVKRLSDGAYFRVLSDGSFNKTPNSAGLDMRQSKAEYLVTLPNLQGAENG